MKCTVFPQCWVSPGDPPWRYSFGRHQPWLHHSLNAFALFFSLHSYRLISVVVFTFPPNLCNKEMLKKKYTSWHMMVALFRSLKAHCWPKRKTHNVKLVVESCGDILACEKNFKAKFLEKFKMCNSYHVSICLSKIRMVFTWFQRNSSQNISKKKWHRWFSTTMLTLTTLITARIPYILMYLTTQCSQWTHLISEHMRNLPPHSSWHHLHRLKVHAFLIICQTNSVSILGDPWTQ